MFVPSDSHEFTLKRLRELPPLKTMIYFTGFLEEERLKYPSGPANTIARVAYELMERGMVHLTQRRISPPTTSTGLISWTGGVGQGFYYIATGATPRKRRRND